MDVARVVQLDAAMLDSELFDLLRSELGSALGALTGEASLATSFKPEMDLTLGVLSWLVCVRRNKPTPGMALQNLKYRNEALFSSTPHRRSLSELPNDSLLPSQRLGMLILTTLLPYALDRVRELSLFEDWASADESRAEFKMFKALELCERSYSVVYFANSVGFLFDGKYRTISDRVLRARLVYAKNEVVRNVSYDLLNQRMLYNSIGSLLSSLAPYVDVNWWSRTVAEPVWSAALTQLLRLAVYLRFIKRYFTGTREEESSQVAIQSAAGGTLESCASCENVPTQPVMLLPCEHVSCHYCAVDSKVCDVCGTPIESVSRCR